MNEIEKVLIEFDKEELLYLENDLISYMIRIKDRVLGENNCLPYAFDDEKEGITEEQKKILDSLGYYDRLELYKKLNIILHDNFPELSSTC